MFILNFWSSQFLRLLRPCNKWRRQKKIKPKSFHQYSWNSEFETTCIGWPHKKSKLLCLVFYLPLSDANHSCTAAASRSLISESKSRETMWLTWGSNIGKKRQFIAKTLLTSPNTGMFLTWQRSKRKKNLVDKVEIV